MGHGSLNILASSSGDNQRTAHDSKFQEWLDENKKPKSKKLIR